MRFQNAALYDSMTVGENLEFSLKRNFKKLSGKEVDTAVTEVLESIGLAEAINKNAFGIMVACAKESGLHEHLF